MNRWLIVTLIASFSHPYSVIGNDDLAQLSYYRGYIIWKDQLRRPGVEYDLEQVISGMRAAETGHPPDLSDVELDEALLSLQEKILALEIDEGLRRAERFLTGLSTDPNAIELVKGKLYFKRLVPGQGSTIDLSNGQITLSYTVKSLEKDGEQLIVNVSEPALIALESTIPGFSKGVIGMQPGEERRLFIHPDLAYGKQGYLIGPNRLIIFDLKAPQ